MDTSEGQVLCGNQVKEIIGRHEAWLRLEKGGEKANLANARLRWSITFSGDLSGADLRSFNFLASDVQGLKLNDACLMGADLSNVSGLSQKQLAGANLESAKLPTELSEFKGLEKVDDVAKTAEARFMGMLYACLFAFVIITFVVKDEQLVANTASLPLPGIGTVTVPSVAFHLLVPLFLVASALYTQRRLQDLWERLSGLPAVFPDGVPLYEKTLVGPNRDFVCASIARLGHSTLLSEWPRGLFVVLAWCTVPITLFVFWFYYLRRHDWMITLLHVGLMGFVAASARASYRRAAATLRHRAEEPSQRETARIAVAAAFLCLLLTGLSLGAVHFIPPFAVAQMNGADLHQAKLSGARLQGAKLRQANLTGADLSEADLSGADLTDAILTKTNLTKCRFNHAKLAGADLTKAKLIEVDLSGFDLHQHTKLKGAAMFGSRLVGADLSGVDLREVDTENPSPSASQLEGTDGYRIDLSGAKLNGANLCGLNLAQAKLEGAHLRNAKLARAKLHGAHLEKALLDHSVLRRAQCPGAHFEGAFLGQADMRDANLVDANLGCEDLAGANLGRANLSGAHLTATDLSQTKFYYTQFHPIRTEWPPRFNWRQLEKHKKLIRTKDASASPSGF